MTTTDTTDLVSRVLAIRRGELPQDAVTIEELRAAVAAQRKRFSDGAEAAATKKASGKRKESTQNFDFNEVSLFGD
jgi:hypothetical protein